ncbi:MAG: histidine kinase [Rudaea sp.]|nr:histidine kinase [Rudaea sp.]
MHSIVMPRRFRIFSRSTDRLRRGISLKLRLMLMITLLIAVVAVLGGVYIVQRAHDDIRGEVRSATMLTKRYLDAELVIAQDYWETHAATLPQLQLASLHEVRHIDVSFYDMRGRLLDSNADGEDPEATTPAWFAWLVRNSFPVLTDYQRPVLFDGLPVGLVVIHPDPAYELEEIWSVSRGLLSLLLLFFILVNALVWWAVGRAMRPVEHIRVALNRLGAGNLGARLPPLDVPELASLSGEFNHMAATLERNVLENRRLHRQVIETQEHERKHIARELHDEIGQCVTAIHADAVAIHRSGDMQQAAARESAAAIIDVTARIKDLLRSMLRRLRPAALDELGLEVALRELIATVNQRNPELICTFRIDEPASELKGECANAIYRLVQEGLTNVVRHARAHRVSIDIGLASAIRGLESAHALALQVVVEDDGIGFDTSAVVTGLGLVGMRERITAMDGSLHIDSAPGRGTRLSADLPVAESGGEGQ